MVKNCSKLATDQRNKINGHLVTSTLESDHQDLVNKNSYITAESEVPPYLPLK